MTPFLFSASLKYMSNPINQDNQKFILKIALLLGLIAIVLVAILRDRIVNYPRREISVAGQGRIFVKPDIAQVTLAVNVFKKRTAAEAVKESAEKINKILAKIRELGIDDKDIQTTTYNLNPEYESSSGKSSIAGYTLNQQIKIKVRNLENVGKVIEATVGEGANQIGNVEFVVDDLEKLRGIARAKAIEQAKEKAKTMAALSEIKLGKVVGLWENTPSIPGPYPFEGMGGGEVSFKGIPALPQGQNEIIVEVTLNYEVK